MKKLFVSVMALVAMALSSAALAAHNTAEAGRELANAARFKVELYVRAFGEI